MEKGKNYPLRIGKVKEVDITAEDFHKLSYIGLASLFCSFKIVIERTDEYYSLYMRDGEHNRFHEVPRFKNVKYYLYPSSEMVQADIPIGDKLIDSIEKYFKHLILK